MKKIYLTLLLLIPALFASAQGPVKIWNDQLDTFIDLFNGIDTSLDQLYSDNGITDTFTYTYFDPSTLNVGSRYSLTDAGNVIKETTIFDPQQFNYLDEDMLSQAKSLAIRHLADGARKNSKMNGTLNEFIKRDINIILLYSTEKNGNKLTEEIVITPREIQAAK